jgi:hypothetical protein
MEKLDIAFLTRERLEVGSQFDDPPSTTNGDDAQPERLGSLFEESRHSSK